MKKYIVKNIIKINEKYLEVLAMHTVYTRVKEEFLWTIIWCHSF